MSHASTEFLTKLSGPSESEKPLCIDLFCGLGGWAEGFLAEGWRVVGFDIERHDYGTGGYPGLLVLQDILTLHGSQLKDAAVIVASPPCQEYSYMAMPWSRAKQIAADYRSGVRDTKNLTALFDACFRLQREASEAAGRYIPLIVENVRGAQPWVGRSRWHYGSFHLWGDVPALMPLTMRARKVPGFRFDGSGGSFQTASVEHTKNTGGSWFNVAHNTESGVGKNPVHELVAAGTKLPGNNGPRRWEDREVQRLCDATKVPGLANGKFPPGGLAQGHIDGTKLGGDCFSDPSWPGKQGGVSKGPAGGWFNDNKRAGKDDTTGYLSRSGSKSDSRKAASAQIAKIPFPLANHIARVFKPIAHSPLGTER